MDIRQFLVEFEHIASAPNGVEQLRQLVMGLALSGDLLTNNGSLPEEFETHLENAKKKYYANSSRKPRLPVFGNALIEEFPIPTGWRWLRVGNLCDLQTGGTPSRQRLEYFGGEIKWLVSGDIHQGEIFDCEGRITEDGLQNSNCKILPPGSVLIALNGQGKTRATAAILRVPAACNQSLVAMIPFSKEILLSEYLYLALKYRYYEIRDITGQNQRRGLNMRLVSRLSIPLPPTEEQEHIITKVSYLFTLCNKLERQLSEKYQTSSKLTRASIESITGISSERRERMKTPKTELVSNLSVGTIPAKESKAPLAAILVNNNGKLSAKTLWNASGLQLDEFYQQLRIEMTEGWIVQPEAAYVKEVEKN